jgi:hypothetical protein
VAQWHSQGTPPSPRPALQAPLVMVMALVALVALVVLWVLVVLVAE